MTLKKSNSLEKIVFKYYNANGNKISSDVITIYGLSQDYIFEKIRRDKIFYEHDLLFHLLKTIEPKSSIIIDVGANIGNHSIYFGKYLCNKVIAIEPSKKLGSILKQNLSQNLTKDNFEIHQIAVGNQKKNGNLVIPDEANLGSAKLEFSSNSNFSSELVFIEKLDSIVKEADISMIKIDVEGFEIDVLKGAEKLIENNLPHLIIEAHDDIQLNEIKKFLKKYNYKILGKFCSTPTYHFINEPKHQMKNLSIFKKIIYQFSILRNKINRKTSFVP